MVQLSVVIPSYNCSAWLERAVRSTQQMGVVAPEVLVVDDGSTDETCTLGPALAAAISGVRYLRIKNGGVSAARNYGIAHATGRYILLLDADDELLSCDLSPVLSINADMVRIGVQEIMNEVPVHIYQDDAFTGAGTEYLSLRFGDASFYTPSWAYLYRREWLVASGLEFWPGLLHEDTLFTVQALLAAKKVTTSPTIVYRYIRRQGSITTDGNELKLRRRIGSLSIVVTELTKVANRHKEVDFRWWIDQAVHNAAALAAMCQGLSQRLRVIGVHCRYMLAYRGYETPGLRYWQRRRLKELIFGYRRKGVDHL